MSFSYDEVRTFRRRIAMQMLDIQNEFLRSHDKPTVIPNMIAALLSLAAFIARKYANMSRANLERVCEAAIDEQYERDDRLEHWS
jgi:hypothetical protein